MLKRIAIFPAILACTLLPPALSASQPEAAPPAAPARQPEAPRPMLDRIPARMFEYWRAVPGLVGSPDRTWRREIITVAFSGASEPVYELIERAASEWTARGGGTRFSFRDDQGRFRTWSATDTYPAAAIRIGFSEAEDDGGYWSVIGTMAETVPAGQQTMNFGGFVRALEPYYARGDSAEWLQSYDHSTILHEFGHALGLSHEHFHPDCQRDLRLDAAIAYLMGSSNNWEESQARFNIDADYYFREMSGGGGSDETRPARRFDISQRIDRASVMLYSFPDNSYYRLGNRSPCRPSDPRGYPTSLSAADIAAFIRYYPVGGRR